MAWLRIGGTPARRAAFSLGGVLRFVDGGNMTQEMTRPSPGSYAGRPPNPLLRLLGLNLAIGAAVAALAVAGIFSFNLFGMRELAMLDQSPALAIAILAFGFVVTFGSVTMGAAVMMLGEGTQGDCNGKPLRARVPAATSTRPH